MNFHQLLLSISIHSATTFISPIPSYLTISTSHNFPFAVQWIFILPHHVFQFFYLLHNFLIPIMEESYYCEVRWSRMEVKRRVRKTMKHKRLMEKNVSLNQNLNCCKSNFHSHECILMTFMLWCKTEKDDEEKKLCFSLFWSQGKIIFRLDC